MAFLDRIPWFVLIVAALTLGLAPFTPKPHVVEKIQMLFSGKLRRPLDIFDLLMHGLPIILIVLKSLRSIMGR